MRFTLIVSAPLETPGGGFFYLRRMADGMRRIGQAVDARILAGAQGTPDADLRATAIAALERDGLVVIDGLALPAFVGNGDALEAAGACGLVHNAAALGDGVPDSLRPMVRNAGLRLLPRLRRIVASSQAVADRLASEFGVDPQKMRVVVPGTDDAPRAQGSGGEGCAILSIGALIARKGHDILLRALARLFDLDWRLTIVGSASRDPECARALADLVASLGIAEKVSFVGAVDDARLDRLWAEADLYASASHWEPYGASVAQALRRGLPVAVAKGGAAAELVTPEAGVVVEPGDIDQLSKAMRRLIFDRGLRAEMAEAAWAIGRTLPGWESQVRAFLAALTD